MRSNWICGIGAFALVVGLSIHAASSAQAAQKAAGKAAKIDVLKELREAHRLLAEADRDYDGHRAKAAEEVHKAIREVEGKRQPKKAAGTTPTPPAAVAKSTNKSDPAMHESQAKSDEQLTKAQAILQKVQPRLKASHPKAAANVAAAIDELKTALSIK